MQKFGFAVKVLGIIILIPVLVILEINHGLPENKQHSVVEKKDDKTITQLLLTTESQDDNTIAY